MSLPPGILEDKYEVLHKIKEGGMGAVYKVRHLLLDEVRVVKVIRQQHSEDEDLRERFYHEARTTIRLRHPGIAQVFDFSVADDETAVLVMEYIDGYSLKELLQRRGPLEIGLVVEIAEQCLRALSFLHHKGYIHRDISPDNVMLSRDHEGRPLAKLIDLGIAKRLGGTSMRTATGMFLGKARYSAPEQFGDQGLDGRSDIYSFGVLLYELLTGRLPIEGDEFSQLIAGHLFRPPLDFDVSDPDGRLPPELREVILRTLAKEPDDRVASAAELAELLRPFKVPFASPFEGLSTDGPAGGESLAPATPAAAAVDPTGPTRIAPAVPLAIAETVVPSGGVPSGGVPSGGVPSGVVPSGRVQRGPALTEVAPRTMPVEQPVDVTVATGAAAVARSRRRLLGWLGLAVFLVVLVAAGAWLRRSMQPPTAEELQDQALAALAREDAGAAADLLREAIALRPASAAEGAGGVPYVPHYHLGRALFELNNYPAALAAWQDAEAQGVVQATPSFSELREKRREIEGVLASEIAAAREKVERTRDIQMELESFRADEGMAAFWAARPDMKQKAEEVLARLEPVARQVNALGKAEDAVRDAAVAEAVLAAKRAAVDLHNDLGAFSNEVLDAAEAFSREIGQ